MRSCIAFFLVISVFLGVSFLPASQVHASPFTKLDSQGNELQADATGWSMVRDNTSGLVWEAKSNDGSVHDQDNLYSWKKTRKAFLSELNREKFGGLDGWRLPEETELEALSKIKKEQPDLYEKFFPNTAPKPYWSWTYCQDGSVNSLQIKFGPEKTEKKRQYRARAVHGEHKE